MSGTEVMVEEGSDKAKPFEAPIEEAHAAPEAELNPNEMTREELDTLLAEEPAETPPTTEDKGENSEGEPTSKEEPPAEPEDDSEGEPDDSDTIAQEEYEALLAENERLKKKAENQDKFFDRMGTEVGLLRKRTPEEEKAELERIRDIYYEDPVAGHKALTEYHEKQNEAIAAQTEYQTNQLIDSNRESISTLIPDFTKNQGELVEELAKLMAEDNAKPEYIEAFKAQPFRMDQSTLYNLYHRNIAVKELAAKDTEIASLRSEIEELKGKPDQLLGNIERASKVQTMSGRSGGVAVNAEPAITKPVHRLTKEELDKI